MVKKLLGEKIKIAIYDGVIPSSIFIENLIGSLSKKEVKIYLFGRSLNKCFYYSQNVKIFSYPKNKILSLGFIFIQILYMLLMHPRRLKKIYFHYKSISKKEKIHFINWWRKILPVVNNLPDIFHIQWAKALPKWFFLKDLFNVKLVLSLRGAHINYSPLADIEIKDTYKQLFPHVDVFHAVSDAIRFEAQRYGALDSKIKTVYSGIDLPALNNFRKTNWSIQKTFHFLSVGRYHWKKGYQYALIAIKELLNENFDVHYTIIAKNEPSEEVLYQIHDLSIKDSITLTSSKTQKGVYKKMSESDCLLLPSVEEGVANVILEAMALGVPVISSNCGGMTEVIDDGSNGLIFNKRDTSNLANVMKNFIKMHEDQKRQMVKKARKQIEKKHDYDALGNKMYQLYKSIEL